MGYSRRDRTACIIGIDPGGKLGLCRIYFDVISLEIYSVHLETVNLDKLEPRGRYLDEVIGTLRSRVEKLYDYLSVVFAQDRPLAVACELPFFSFATPTAFTPLLKYVSAIENALTDWHPFRLLQMIDPPSVKKAVAVPGNAKKDAVKAAAIKILETLPLDGDMALDEHTEHAYDAFAVAWVKFKDYGMPANSLFIRNPM